MSGRDTGAGESEVEREAAIARFLDDPFADHPPGMQRLLFSLRDRPAAGKLVFVEVEDGRRWQLARLGGRGRPVERLDTFFEDLREAERYVFRQRMGMDTNA